jgi:hypothetical protein
METYPDKPLGNILQIAIPRAPRNLALTPVLIVGISAGHNSELSEAVSS